MSDIICPVEIYALCKDCAKEFVLPIQRAGNTEEYANRFGINFCNCPHCGKRNDFWIQTRRSNEYKSLESELSKAHARIKEQQKQLDDVMHVMHLHKWPTEMEKLKASIEAEAVRKAVSHLEHKIQCTAYKSSVTEFIKKNDLIDYATNIETASNIKGDG